MTRLFLTLALLLLPFSAAAAECGDGRGERGVALLVGVSNYRAPADDPDRGAWTRLGNAVHDVEHVCAGLAASGFATVILRDPTFEQLDAAIFDFHNAAQQADLAVVYYAGHGFEFRGQPYVVPVDAPKRTSLSALIGDFVPMARLLNAASASRQFGLFLLDACRTRDQIVQVVDAAADEPGNAPGAVGLVSVPDGAVIFSTVVGRPALDEAPVGSELSPFASAIVAGMELPGLELTDFYAFVHEDVVRRTGEMAPLGPQYPALYKIAPSKFYLVEPPNLALATVGRVLAGRMMTALPLDLPPLERLAVEDEPKLVREVLGKYSFYELVNAAERGNPVAQYLVGYAYEFGIGVDVNLEQASRWLERSAAQGHPGGLLELAYFLQHGAETAAPDRREALAARARELYEQAAATGYAKAQSHLAAMLLTDSLSRPAEEQASMQQRAIGLFEQAAAAGHVYALFGLAAYSPERREAAEARLEEIAAAGNAEGSNWLCQLYYSSGQAGLVEDHCEIAALNGFGTSRAIYATILAGAASDEAGQKAAYWAQLALAEPELATIPDLHAVARGLAEQPAR